MVISISFLPSYPNLYFLKKFTTANGKFFWGRVLTFDILVFLVDLVYLVSLVDLVSLVYLVYLVYLVCLVCLVFLVFLVYLVFLVFLAYDVDRLIIRKVFSSHPFSQPLIN